MDTERSLTLRTRPASADIRATPAMALGAYDVTPLDMAGAYTVFANKGNYVQPHFVDWIRDSSGTDCLQTQPEEKKVLDPRVDYLMINLMQEVLRSGTGAGVRARGFKLPAAERPERLMTVGSRVSLPNYSALFGWVMTTIAI